MFVKATREKIALKLAVTGPSGSGKTMSALRLAAGLGKKIAVIDTENGSASLYADRVEFDVAVLDAPYTVKKYVEAIKAAQMAGYEVVVIDSLSHEWAGEGGLLDQKAAKEAAGKNGFTAWNELGQQHELLKAAILQSSLHIIATIRSKQGYEIIPGTNKPQKVGMAPIQRDGMEYEFTTVWDVQMDHRALTSKDRTGLFVDEIAQITEEHGTRLLEWLKTAKAPAEQLASKVTADEMKTRLKEHATNEYRYAGNVGRLAVALLGRTPDKWTAEVYAEALDKTQAEWVAAITSLEPPVVVSHSAVVSAPALYTAPNPDDEEPPYVPPIANAPQKPSEPNPFEEDEQNASGDAPELKMLDGKPAPRPIIYPGGDQLSQGAKALIGQ